MKIMIEVKPLGGSSIHEVCGEAIELAKRIMIPVCFKFNGIEIIAFGSNTVDELVQDYHKYRMIERMVRDEQ
jgi:hypothetical protein